MGNLRRANHHVQRNRQEARARENADPGSLREKVMSPIRRREIKQPECDGNHDKRGPENRARQRYAQCGDIDLRPRLQEE